MVDEWIDSGIKEDWIDTKDGSIEHRIEERRQERKLKLNTQLRAEVFSFLQRCKPFTVLSTDGSSLISEFMFTLNEPPRDLALKFFLDFFKSDRRFSLMRCKFCRKLALPSKLRDVYQLGWFCESHTAERKKATVKKSRADDDANILVYGAKALLRYKPQDLDKTRFITQEINARLPWDKKIKTNTVSRHMELIEALARDISLSVSPEMAAQRLQTPEESGAFDKVLIGGLEDRPSFIVGKGRKQNAKG